MMLPRTCRAVNRTGLCSAIPLVFLMDGFLMFVEYCNIVVTVHDCPMFERPCADWVLNNLYGLEECFTIPLVNLFSLCGTDMYKYHH